VLFKPINFLQPLSKSQIKRSKFETATADWTSVEQKCEFKFDHFRGQITIKIDSTWTFLDG
jgi:hypothetical protein